MNTLIFFQLTQHGHGLTRPRDPRKPTAMTEAALLKALRGLSEKGAPASTLHGFRHAASTILHSRGENTLHIEKQLAHLDPNRIRAVYNKYEFLDERRAMLQRYADFIDELKSARE